MNWLNYIRGRKPTQTILCGNPYIHDIINPANLFFNAVLFDCSYTLIIMTTLEKTFVCVPHSMVLINVFYLTENIALKNERRVCFDTQSRDQVTPV
jgi:hypothetical protein